MKYHVLPRMACGCAIFVFAFAHCGCQSTKSGGGWASVFTPKPKDINPNDREIVTYWGQKKSKPAPNVDELKEKMARGADDTERGRLYAEHIKQGNQALRAKRWEEARREYEKALVARPDDADCHHRLAVVADNEHQFGVADVHYEAAVRQRPRDPNLLSDFGYSYLLRGDDTQAEKTLNRALALAPSHKGAMANLGAIYAKQGRFDEALVMFRRGGTEAEAQQYVADLFPQNRDATGNAGGTALAQNAASASPRSAASPERADFSKMTPEQVKAEMERARLESIQKRQQQMIAESQPPRNDWSTEIAPSRPPTTAPQAAQPWILGNGGSTQTPANQPPSQAMPYGANPQYAMNNPAYGAAPPQGTSNTGGQFSPPNGFASQGSNNGSAIAPPGTNPNIDLWQGVPIQPAGAVQNQYPTPSSNMPNSAGSIGGQFNPAANFGMQPSRSTTPNAPPGLNWGGTGTPGPLPQGGAFTPGSSAGEGSSASMAAAQLGMNVGPGGLFPVVSADASNSQGFGGNPAPSFQNRFGGEYPATPNYQAPATQFAPNQLPNLSVDPRQGAAPSSNWSGGFNAAPSHQPPNVQNAWGSASSLPSIAPPSPASDWAQPGTQSAVVQAGGSFAGQSRSGTPDALDSFQFEMNAGTNRRGSNSGWGDSSAPTAGSSGQYSGPWPNGNSIPSTAPPSAQASNWGGNGTQTNSPPPWNGGAAANSAPQNSFGPATSNGSASTLDPWPHAPQR